MGCPPRSLSQEHDILSDDSQNPPRSGVMTHPRGARAHRFVITKGWQHYHLVVAWERAAPMERYSVDMAHPKSTHRSWIVCGCSAERYSRNALTAAPGSGSAGPHGNRPRTRRTQGHGDDRLFIRSGVRLGVSAGGHCRPCYPRPRAGSGQGPAGALRADKRLEVV